jgi:hypothetical protein
VGRHSPQPKSPLSSSTNPSPAEFHRYRKLVAWTAVSAIAIGTLYLTLSVVVALVRQRNVVLGDRISVHLTPGEIGGCFDELHDVSVALEKHLENAYHLLGGYDSAEAQRWSGEGQVWRQRWRVLGERCRFAERRPDGRNKDLEAMSAAHEELGSIQTTYSRELLRFGNELAPRLDRINRRVEQIGEHLGKAGSPPGAPP